jgi:hypothetical protein
VRRIRLIMLSLVAVFAMSGVAAVAAQAESPEWWVNGAALGAGFEEIKEESKTASEAFKLRWHSNEVEVKCTKVKAEKTFIENQKIASAKSVKFEGCTLEKPVGCTLTSGEIKTGEVTGLLEGPVATAKVKFVPRATENKKFATFSIATGCGVLTGAYTVTGFTIASVVEPETAAVEKTLAFTEATNLKVGGLVPEEFKGKIGGS